MTACTAASAAAVAASVAALTAILCMPAALDLAAPMMEGLDFRADDLFFFLFFATDKLLFRPPMEVRLLNSSQKDQDQKNNDHQPESAPSVVAGPVERPATPATEATKQEEN